MPVLDEAPVIGPFLAELAPHAQGRTVYLLDSGSKDDTVAEARRAAERHRLDLVVVASPPGLAAAVQHGIEQTSAPRLAVIDGDAQHDPAVLDALFRALDAGADIAVGSRFVPGAAVSATWPTPRRLLSAVLVRVLRLGGRCHGVTDPLSGCFALHRAQWTQVAARFESGGFKFLLDLLTVSPPLRATEAPITFRARPGGESKVSLRTLGEAAVSLAWNLLRGRLSRRVISFGSVGALGTLWDVIITTVLHTVLGAPFWAARTAGALAGLSNNYLLNNLLTFRDRRHESGRLLRGWLLSGSWQSFGALVNYGTSVALYSLGLWWPLAMAGGIAAGVTLNYTTASRLVWRKTARKQSDRGGRPAACTRSQNIEASPTLRDTAQP